MRLVPKRGSTLHDFPYRTPDRKCPHFWIINLTPPGPSHCIHNCIYCYARTAIYSDFSEDMIIYNNIPELVEKDLKKLKLCPPVSISNISDPCQDVKELKGEMKRLIKLLISYNIPFIITTKGDPTFLLEVEGFKEFEPKIVSITIEGTEDILPLLSKAPPFGERINYVKRLSSLGIRVNVRLDPLFPHLFRAIYGEGWLGEVERIIELFSESGARHLIVSTGRLTKRKNPKGEGSLYKVKRVIERFSKAEASRFEEEYKFEVISGVPGYFLRRDLREKLHLRLREIAHKNNMTYGICQELGEEFHSPGIKTCEGFPLPFSKKNQSGKFEPIEGCTSLCHINCTENPPCGNPLLISPEPFKKSLLTSWNIRRSRSMSDLL